MGRIIPFRLAQDHRRRRGKSAILRAMKAAKEFDTFSYASPDDPWLKRILIRLVERTTGQPYLKWLYEDNRAHPVKGESFWAAAVRRLELKVVCNEDALARWPRQGALIIVANHPFGVLDGLVMSYLSEKARPDFRILTNNVLTRADEIRDFLLPIDFAETKEALATNLKSRAAALAHLKAGGCLIVFPAGGVSTAPKPWSRHAIDTEWKNFAAKLIVQGRAPVVPVYFAGQNSRLFQMVSHVSLTLRLSLLFKEVHDRIGSDVHVRIGEIIPFEQLAKLDRGAIMEYLRKATYALGNDTHHARPKRVKRPKHAPKLRRAA